MHKKGGRLVPDAETSAGAKNLYPHMRWGGHGRTGIGGGGCKGVGSDSCHISHARLPACKAHPVSRSRTGRGQRSCTLFSARFLLIARLPLPFSPHCSRTLPRCLSSSLCRIPRRSANKTILPRTSAQQIAQTCTLQSGVCAKQPEGSG